MNTTEFSRRTLLVVGTASVLGATANRARAQAKLAQKDADYQAQRKGNQRCDNCIQFEAPAACKVVEGQVAAQGWCKVWAAKPG